jgi:hypothetical protein
MPAADLREIASLTLDGKNPLTVSAGTTIGGPTALFSLAANARRAAQHLDVLEKLGERLIEAEVRHGPADLAVLEPGVSRPAIDGPVRSDSWIRLRPIQ